MAQRARAAISMCARRIMAMLQIPIIRPTLRKLRHLKYLDYARLPWEPLVDSFFSINRLVQYR